MKHRKSIINYIPLDDRKSGIFLFVMGFLAYVILYFGRLNYSAAMTLIIGNGDMTREAAASISTVFYIAYGLSTFVNGFLADKLSPFNMIGCGVILSGFFNLCMGSALYFNAPHPVLIIIWAANGIVQSTIWSPLIRIISTILPKEQRSTACSNILITTAVGSFGSFILSTILLRGGKIEMLFIIPGIILPLYGVIWILSTYPITKKIKVYLPKENNNSDNVSSVNKKWALKPLLAASGVLLVIIPASLISMINNGVSNWTPTIITEMFNFTPSMAVLLTALLPFGNIFGAAVSHIVIKKFSYNELKASVFFLILSFFVLALMFIIGNKNIVTMIICLAVISALMIANSNIYVTFIPSAFGKYGRAATVAGILNAFMNLFGSLSSIMIGYITGIFKGWNVMFGIWTGMCIIGLAACFLIMSRWQRFSQNNRTL